MPAFYDPFNLFGDPYQSPARLRPLPKEEEESALRKMAGALGTGVAWVGQTLNKPGRAVRGTLAGRPEELLNLLPFSDTFGLTDPATETTGRNLLEMAGLVEPGVPGSGLDFGDVAGFATDILTDPTTFLYGPASALTKAGKAAQVAGTLPARVGERAAAGLGGHFGLGVPFLTDVLPVNLSWPLSKVSQGTEWATRTIPGAGRAAEAAGTLRRGARSLFDRSVMGTTSAEVQPIAEAISAGRPAAEAAGRRSVQELIKQAADLGFDTPEKGRELRQLLEGTLAAPTPEVEGLVSGYRSLTDDLLKRLQGAGLPDKELDDPIGLLYATRQATVLSQEAGWGFRKRVGPSEQARRQEILKGLPTEGPLSLNEASRNPALSGLKRTLTDPEAEHLVRTQYLKVDDDARFHLTNKKAAEGLSEAEDALLKDYDAKAVQARHLADWLKNLDPNHAEQGIGFFDNHPLKDLMDKALRDEVRLLKAKGLHEGIAKLAEPTKQNLRATGGVVARTADEVPLLDVLRDAGLTYDVANQPIGAMQQTLDALKKLGKVGAGSDRTALSTLTVPPAAAKDLTRFFQAARAPDGLAPFLNVWDSITNLTKTAQTALWPANHARNQASAIFQNWLHEAYDPTIGANPLGYVQTWLDAKAWREGKVLRGLDKIPEFAGMTPEQATQAFAQEVLAWDIPHRQGGQAFETLGSGAKRAVGGLEVPGAPHQTFREILGQAKETKVNPLSKDFWSQMLGVRGVFGASEDVAGLVKAGRGVQQYLDDVNRVSVYLAKRKQGFTPQAARDVVVKAHYDFANLSDFERDTMRRVVPFYSWMRQNVPAMVKQVVDRPGGKVATITKAANRAQDEDAFVPPYLAKGLALPVGAEDATGNRTFLASLGLPFEEVFGMVDPAGAQQSLLGLLGQTNPLVKGPLEWLTGKQFFTGRDLESLWSPTGNIALDQLMMNSPVSRAYTTARTLADERKSPFEKFLNVFTGAKLTDVDVEKWRDRTIQDAVRGELAGVPGVQRVLDLYVKPEDIARLTPEQVRLLQLNKNLAERARQRKKEKQAAGQA